MRELLRELSPLSLSRELAAGDVGSEYALPDAVAHHALRVLRLAVGDRITLFTGAGGEFAATLARADKREAVARIDAFDPGGTREARSR